MTQPSRHVARSTEALETMIRWCCQRSNHLSSRSSLTPQALHDLLILASPLNRDIQSIAVLGWRGPGTRFCACRFQFKWITNIRFYLQIQEEAQHDQTLYSKPLFSIFQGEFPISLNTIPFTHQGKSLPLLIDYKIKTSNASFETGGIGKQGYTCLVMTNKDSIYHPHQALMTCRIKQETIPDLELRLPKKSN